MEYNFYGDYTINDANIDCGRIIISDCLGKHRYATLCELIEDCPGIKQLTRPCIINALNDLQTLGQQSGLSPEKRFLKIGTDGCLEVANPCICDDGNKYVVATEDDNDPGPLSTKVRGSCSEDGLYCIDIELGGPKTLVWRPSGPNGPFINPDMPSCPGTDTAYVKLKKQGGERVVDYKCEEIETSPEHLYAFHNGGTGERNSYRKALRYFAPTGRSNTPAIADETVSKIGGGWTILGTDAFGPAKGIGVFQILRPGIYAISFGAYIETFHTSNIINAIRCGLYIANASIPQPNSGDFIELGDFKYEFCDGMETKVASGQLNKMHPQAWDYNTFFKNYDSNGKLNNGIATDMSGFPFARTYILNLNQAYEIAFRVGVDMRYIDARRTDVDEDDFNITISSVAEAHEDANAAQCRIDCTRLGDSVVSSRMHTI